MPQQAEQHDDDDKAGRNGVASDSQSHYVLLFYVLCCTQSLPALSSLFTHTLVLSSPTNECHDGCLPMHIGPADGGRTTDRSSAGPENVRVELNVNDTRTFNRRVQ